MRRGARVLGLLLVVGCVDGELGFLTPSDLDEIEAEVRRVTGNPIVELEVGEGATVADLVVEARVLQRCGPRTASGTFVAVEYRETRWRIRQEEEGVGAGWGAGATHGQPYPDACACLQPGSEPASEADEHAPMWRNGSSAPCTRSEIVLPLHVQ